MPQEVRHIRSRWLPPALAALAGLILLWTMWMSGGDFWPLQRPFMMVTLTAAAALVAVVVTAAALPRGIWRTLMVVLAIIAMATTFFGEGVAERLRFDDLRASLATEVDAVRHGGACTTPCRIDSRDPARVAFQFSGEGTHWSGVCYDATDTIPGVQYGGRVRPPSSAEAVMLAEATRMFDGEVRHAPAWGDHWYGCSTRP